MSDRGWKIPGIIPRNIVVMADEEFKRASEIFQRTQNFILITRSKFTCIIQWSNHCTRLVEKADKIFNIFKNGKFFNIFKSFLKCA